MKNKNILDILQKIYAFKLYQSSMFGDIFYEQNNIFNNLVPYKYAQYIEPT